MLAVAGSSERVARAPDAVFHGMFDRGEQLCQEALDAAGTPGDELAGSAYLLRGNAPYGLGDMKGAVESLERSVSARRRLGDPFMLGFSLGVLVSFRSRGSVALAADDARESLALLRQSGGPGTVSVALGGLALVLLGTEREESRALIAESIELHDALGAVAVQENALIVGSLVSAVLGERNPTLRLTARGLDRGFSMVAGYCACLEATAQTLAPEQPDVAATLQGTVDALMPNLARAEPYRALRKRATEAIDTQLDAARISELRAQGAAMTEDQATAYALDAITRAQ